MKTKPKSNNKIVKVNIVSGFLGSGKTTFIKKYLDQVENLGDVVVLENEFGEVSIDSEDFDKNNLTIYEINAGCICCSLLGDFKDSLRYILDNYNPDTIFIEPSGVAKVSDIVKILEDIDYIKLDKVITTVNAFTFNMHINTFGAHYKDQIANADAIFLTRIDRLKKIKKDGYSKLIKDLKALNPNAIIIDDLDGLDIKKSILKENKKEESFESLDIESYTFDVDRCYREFQIRDFLNDFINTSKYGFIIRSKGILKGVDGLYIRFDYVDGEINLTNIENPSKTGVVVIGYDLNKKEIHDLLENLS